MAAAFYIFLFGIFLGTLQVSVVVPVVVLFFGCNGPNRFP